MHQSRDGLVWNFSPGALLTQNNQSDSLRHYPFHYNIFGIEPEPYFTAIIYSQLASSLTVNSPIYRLLRSIARSQYVSEVSKFFIEIFTVQCLRYGKIIL